jgi:hypothetical protein
VWVDSVVAQEAAVVRAAQLSAAEGAGTFDEALAPGVPDRAPRDCSRRHTSETYLVGRLGLVSPDGHQLAVEADAVRRQAAEKCPLALADHLGATFDDLRLSMVQPVWFTPTGEQADAGAEWFRCDAIVIAGDRSLMRRSGGLGNAFSDGPGDLGMCGTAAPDEAGFERVACARDHSWRAVRVIEFDDARHPGPEAARTRGRSACEDAGAQHASDPLSFRWSYEWPTRRQWRNGMQYGRCWVPTG